MFTQSDLIHVFFSLVLMHRRKVIICRSRAQMWCENWFKWYYLHLTRFQTMSCPIYVLWHIEPPIHPEQKKRSFAPFQKKAKVPSHPKPRRLVYYYCNWKTFSPITVIWFKKCPAPSEINFRKCWLASIHFHHITANFINATYLFQIDLNLPTYWRWTITNWKICYR